MSTPTLKRGGGPGAWLYGDWTILRHRSDPHPQRWFAYEGDNDEAANMGEGHTRLRDVVAWINHEPLPPPVRRHRRMSLRTWYR